NRRIDREREARNRLEREVPLGPDRSEGLGYEGDNQDRDSDDADELPRRVETRQVVQGRRMPDAQHEDEETEDEPARIEDAHPEQEQDGGPAHVELPSAEERAGDMPAIELTRGEQVDRRHEEADPSREGERMQGERTRKREEEGEEREQDRRPDRLAHRVRRKGGGRRGRQRQARQRDRDRDRESEIGRASWRGRRWI